MTALDQWTGKCKEGIRPEFWFRLLDDTGEDDVNQVDFYFLNLVGLNGFVNKIGWIRVGLINPQ